MGFPTEPKLLHCGTKPHWICMELCCVNVDIYLIKGPMELQIQWYPIGFPQVPLLIWYNGVKWVMSQNFEGQLLHQGFGITCVVDIHSTERPQDKTDIYSHLWQVFRVATAQGKQGIWKYIFPDRENTGNLLKNIKNMFLHREFTTNTGKMLRVEKNNEIVI